MSSHDDLIVVGLTGLTGAGKSTVSKVFASNGFSVIDADKVARIVVEKGSRCLKEITDYFGFSVLNPDGTLNRKALAGIVFTDKAELEALNTIIYPYINREIFRQIRDYSENGSKFVLLDAPQLFESRSDDFCDIIISVVADSEIRKARIIARDSLTEKQAQERMDSQLPAEYFMTNSDYIIENNGSVEDVSDISKEVADKIRNYYHKRNMAVSI